MEQGWDVAETTGLVLKLSGKNTYLTAQASINSVFRRLEYARIQYHEAKDLADKYISENLKEAPMMFVFYRTDEEWEKFNDFIYRFGAKVTAFAQDVHAVADTLAYALYHALDLEKGVARPLKPSRIDYKSVQQLLAGDAKLANIAALYSELVSGGSFPHLAAMVNLSKHRGLVLTSLSEDVRPERTEQQERHTLRISSFEKDGDYFPPVEIKSFLTSEFDRCWELCVDIGRELHAVLKARAS
jgi:hypothetical protein